MHPEGEALWKLHQSIGRYVGPALLRTKPESSQALVFHCEAYCSTSCLYLLATAVVTVASVVVYLHKGPFLHYSVHSISTKNIFFIIVFRFLKSVFTSSDSVLMWCWQTKYDMLLFTYADFPVRACCVYVCGWLGGFVHKVTHKLPFVTYIRLVFKGISTCVTGPFGN